MSSPAGASARPLRSILVVEDDEDTRASLRDFFAAHGFVVHTAEDGARALALLDRLRETLGCILLDLEMPVLDGWQLLARLRGHDGAPPVIVLTGGEDDPPAGARYYFAKPPALDVLLRAAVSCCLRATAGD